MRLQTLIILLFPVLALAQTQPRANQVRVTPSTTLSGTNVQSVLTEIDNEKAGKNILWITKTSTYTPTALDTLLSPVGYSFQSVTDLSFTIPPFTSTNFKRGTTFRIRNDSTNVVSILEGAAVSFKCQTAGPWTLEEDEEAEISKINTTNTWLLKLFKKPNISQETIVPVYTETTTVGNVTAGEDVLFTYTLPGGTMATDGNSFTGRFSGIVANNANVKTIKLKFGSTTIATRTTTTPTIGQGWTINFEVIRTSATTQKANVTFSGSDGIASAYYAATSETMSGDINIVLTGESGSSATNDVVKHTAVGRFDPGAGSGSTPPPIDPPEIPFVIVDNATRGAQGYQWNYVSTWATPGTGISGWYDGTLDYTGTTNAYAEITFNGTRIQLYTEKKNTHGIFEVSLDGTVVDTVDLYSSTALLQQLVFDTNDADDPDHEEGPLTQAVHTLKLRCTGTKNGSSSAYYLIVDYVRIENPETVPDIDLPDPPATATDFVATTGSDGGANNCNSSGSPCRTIVYALTQMSSGDILSVGPGTFTETSYLVMGAGKSIIGSGVDVTTIKLSSSLNYNVDCGALDATKCMLQYNTSSSTAAVLTDLTIEGNGKLVHGGIYLGNSRNNLTVEDVKISNFDYFGAYVTGTGHTFHNVQIINSAEAAACYSTGNLMIGGSTGFMCDNVDISDNIEGYGVKAWGASAIIDTHTFKNSEIRVVPNSPYGGGGIPNIAYELHNCKPRNCLFENNYVDNAVSCVRPTGFADDGIPSVHIKNCTFDMITKGGGTAPLYLNGAINVPIETGVHNLEVSECLFVGGKYAYIVHWNAVESGAAVNQRIHHNVFYCVGHINSTTGIFRSSYAPWNGVYFYNNVVHIPTGMNYHVSIAFTGCCGSGRNSTNVNITNNVIYDQSTADTGVGGANGITRIEGSGGSWASSTFTYNSVIGMSTSLPSGWTAGNTLTTGPSFQGGGGVNPSPFVFDPFYRPAGGSPLLNSGTDVGLGDGATPDRGRIQVP